MDATFFLVAPFERVGRLHLRPLSPHGVLGSVRVPRIPSIDSLAICLRDTIAESVWISHSTHDLSLH